MAPIKSKEPGEEIHKKCNCNNSGAFNRYLLLDTLNQ